MKKRSVWRRFPGAFWAANTMEIFERMGWYGFYAVSTLYLMGSIEEGGLGFSSQDRGVIQAVVTFFLYLFPAFFGALADRYGYKRMFLASCCVMIPSYILLGQARSFWGFFAIYMLVALGHGMFKPVVISTVAKTTNEETGTMGFGIFYMMVNIGGFLGPIVAGIVRGWSWAYVFYASAAWIVVLGLTCLLYYREPAGKAAAEPPRSLREVIAGMIAVVGNGRFFLLVAGLMLILVLGAKWLPPKGFLTAAAVWLAGNLAFDLLLRAGPTTTRRSAWLQPLRVGEKAYLIFLLLMAGFWTSFNQIFMTLPAYIHDYVDTRDLVRAFSPLGGRLAGLTHNDFFLSMGIDSTSWVKGVLDDGQIKPEHLINLNALGIIFGQILVSYLARKLRPFTTIISGVLVTALSFLVYLGGASGFWVVAAILVFSVGEMLASPKSKEYAGRIAPPGKVGLYMGYFYWCVALGNLFGGLLSGVMYAHFGPAGIDRPDLMWIIFAALAFGSTLLLGAYNAWIKRSHSRAESTHE